ncbi:TSUP family transporter [Candidatus Woesearchaeota archaeon]|nr:TSUP family transporter [Candidatus Woesearchaeota archaeon]
MNIELLIAAGVIALILQFFDASLGQGYGTLTPILIILGFDPLDVVLAVLLTSFALSGVTALLHHSYRNIDFSFEKKDFKIAIMLSGFGILGVALGVLLAVNMPDYALKGYIGAVIIITGIAVFLKNKTRSVSWRRLVALGSIASFNKGMTGGGFGPVLAGGQIISGVKSRSAVAITAFVESIVSLAGVIIFLITIGFTSTEGWLIAALLIGGLISTPAAVYIVKHINLNKLRYLIGSAAILSGMIVFLELFI